MWNVTCRISCGIHICKSMWSIPCEIFQVEFIIEYLCGICHVKHPTWNITWNIYVEYSILNIPWNTYAEYFMWNIRWNIPCGILCGISHLEYTMWNIMESILFGISCGIPTWNIPYGISCGISLVEYLMYVTCCNAYSTLYLPRGI